MRALLLTAFLLIAATANAATITGHVIRVHDGDTITVAVGDTTYRVRLYGIDAPELHEAYGPQARDCAVSLALGKDVSVLVKNIDRYGRTVGDVTLPDGRDLSADLAAAGCAWWYARYAPDDDTLRDLEAQAMHAKRGLWADPHPVPPWDYRRSR